MGGDHFVDVARQALWVLALASTPILLPALIVGVLLGMVQAATSINEATLSFIPKLAVVGLCLLLFGGSIMMLLVDFTQDVFARIPELAR
jgi:flagellar biosynthesis protein FliQ